MIIEVDGDREKNGCFAKGNKLGKGGRKGTRPLTAFLKEELDKPELAKELMEVALKKARMGDFKFFNLIWERSEGKIAEQLNINSRTEDQEKFLHTLFDELEKSGINIDKINDILIKLNTAGETDDLSPQSTS